MGLFRNVPLFPMSYDMLTQTMYNSSSIVIDAANEKIGIRFYPTQDDDISHVDMGLTVTGDLSGMTFKMQIETESGGAPSGDVVGGATAAFAGPNVSAGAQQWAGGGTNPVALGTAANIALNTPYWLVLYVNSGTPDGSNKLAIRLSYGDTYGNLLTRHHNGTNWTTTSSTSTAPSYVVKYSNGKIQGWSCLASGAITAVNSIYTNSGTPQVQGLRMRVGANMKFNGVFLKVAKTSSPDNLVITVYEGNTSIYSESVPVANVETQSPHLFMFSSPVFCKPGRNINVVLSNANATSGNNYKLYVRATPENYMPIYFPSGQGMIYGNLGNPEDLTLVTTEIPSLHPIVDWTDTGFKSAAAPVIGGGVIMR